MKTFNSKLIVLLLCLITVPAFAKQLPDLSSCSINLSALDDDMSAITSALLPTGAQIQDSRDEDANVVVGVGDHYATIKLLQGNNYITVYAGELPDTQFHRSSHAHAIVDSIVPTIMNSCLYAKPLAGKWLTLSPHTSQYSCGSAASAMAVARAICSSANLPSFQEKNVQVLKDNGCYISRVYCEKSTNKF